MSYTKSTEARVIGIRPMAQISANATLRGPLMKFAGEIVGADISSSANHAPDDGSNYFVIAALANGNTAFSLNTGTTDVNAGTVTFPTRTSTVANRRFASGEEITVTFTETGTAVNFETNATVWVHVIPVFDHSAG